MQIHNEWRGEYHCTYPLSVHFMGLEAVSIQKSTKARPSPKGVAPGWGHTSDEQQSKMTMELHDQYLRQLRSSPYVQIKVSQIAHIFLRVTYISCMMFWHLSLHQISAIKKNLCTG